MSQSRWELRKGDVLLGTLVSYEWDFPWINCNFTPTDAFAAYRPLFDEAQRLFDATIDKSDDAWDTWDTFYEQVVEGMRLAPMGDSERIKEFLLHIEGDAAWFRPIFED
jgi:hypothetical protein